MENILKKALSEALTPLYSEELRDAYDTGYKFSPEFEDRMNGLIRKSRRPLWLRPGYLAAAACAVIAIGSAILIPALMNNRVDTRPPADTSATVGTTELPEPDVTVTTPGTTAPASSETAKDQVSGTTSGSSEATPDADNGSEEILPSSGTENSVSDAGQAIPTEEVPSDVTDSNTGNGDPAPISQDGNDMEEAVDNETDDDSDDDIVTSLEPSIAESEDDDISVDEADSDDAVITDPGSGDYQVDEEVKIPVNDGDRLGDVVEKFAENNYDIGSYEELYAYSASYCPNGVQNVSSETLNFFLTDYSFIQEFVHGLGDASAVSEDFQPEGAMIVLYLGNKQIKPHDMTRSFYNNSAWLRYPFFYDIDNAADEWIDEDSEDDYDVVDEGLCQLNVYANGFVTLKIDRFEKDPETGKTIMYTPSNTYFKYDAQKCAVLFDKLASLYIPDTVKTVGDISAALGINAGNIAQAWAGVNYIYDTQMSSAKIGYDYIESLFASHASDNVYDNLNENAVYDVNGEILISFYTKASARVDITMSLDGMCFVQTGKSAMYRFGITRGDIINALNAIGAANNVTIPIFDTLAEYEAAKYFSVPELVSFRGEKDGQKGWFEIKDAEELKAIYDLIKSEFTTARYLVEKAGSGVQNIDDINIFVHSFMSEIKVGKDDILYFRHFRAVPFKMSDGFTEKLKKLLASSKTAEFMPLEEELDEVTDDCDDDEEAVDDVDEDNVDD
ncbi:MAG: hypothetical protein K5876_07115 [Ruminiclostridium sp.]|nr:hypothetical protein [Ruminiclostridium sp.]